MIEAIAPVLACLACFSVPIVLILTKHQQKMTVLLQNQNRPGNSESLERAVQDLTYLAHQQSIAIQNLTETVNRMERQSAADIPSRLTSNA